MSDKIKTESLQALTAGYQLAGQVQEPEQLRFLFASLLALIAQQPGLSVADYLTALEGGAKARGILPL